MLNLFTFKEKPKMYNILGIGGSCVVVKDEKSVIKIIPDIEKYNYFLDNTIDIKKCLKKNIGEKITEYFIFPESFKELKRDFDTDNFLWENNCNIKNLDYENYLVIKLPYYENSIDCFDYFVKNRKSMDIINLDIVLEDFWSGLEILHENGIIHNDVKLENVLLSNENGWKLRIIDFDFSFQIEEANNISYVGTFSLINQTTGINQETIGIDGMFKKFFRFFKPLYNPYKFSIYISKFQEELQKMYIENKEDFYRYNDIFNGIILSLFMIKMNEKNRGINKNVDNKFVKSFLEMVKVDENLKFMEIFEIKNYLKKMII